MVESPIGDPQPDAGARVEARTGAATAEVLPYYGGSDAADALQEEGRQDERQDEIGDWIDEILPEALAERGLTLDTSEAALVKNALLDPFVAERLQTKDDITSLIAFLIEVLEENSVQALVAVPDAKRVFQTPKFQPRPSLITRLKNSLHSGADWVSEQIKPWIIFGIIRYRILTGPMQGGQPIDYASHTQKAWKRVTSWLNPDRKPTVRRCPKKDLPRTFRPNLKTSPALPLSILKKPSGIPDFVDLVRLQVAHAVPGEHIRALQDRYPNVPLAVIHEVLRRDELRFKPSPDRIRRGVAQIICDCFERDGRLFTRPIFQKDRKRNQIIINGERGPWKPEYTLFPEKASLPRPQSIFSPVRLVVSNRQANGGSSLKKSEPPRFSSPRPPTFKTAPYTIFESEPREDDRRY